MAPEGLGDYSLWMESDTAYFRRRATEEHIAAAHADSSEAFQAHHALAGRYEELALAIETRVRACGLEATGEASPDTDAQPQTRASMWL